MLSAQADQEKFTNLHRSPAPAYRLGDWVLLSTRNLKLKRPIKKFSQQYLGPFRVEEVQGPHTYRLDLRGELGTIHSSFHTDLLRPALNDPLPGQFNPPPPRVMIDDDGNKL
jgi:hypothetical protein